jgi:hypothetical protein
MDESSPALEIILRSAPHGAMASAVCFSVMLALGAAIGGREAAAAGPAAESVFPPGLQDAAAAAKQSLKARHGVGSAGRIDRGVEQVRRSWRPEDGDAETFREFVVAEFIPAGTDLDAAFARFEFALERIAGYSVSLSRDLQQGVDLDLGPMLPLDLMLAGYDPSAHLTDDFFRNKLAFVALLNFPLTTLRERLDRGMGWSRREWAETRLAQRFSARVPAEVSQRITATGVQAESYINGYNIYMHHLLDEKGQRLFPEGLRLITHWGLRDELKARYSDPEGVAKQRMIQTVMDRIVRQEIPAAVINNPLLDWAPALNAVTVSPVKDAPAPPGAATEPRTEREADERYRRWLANFQAGRLADPYFPDDPTVPDRRFNVDREIPEAEVESLLESVLLSPLGERVGRLVAKRLGRPLQPFDIWYAGFKPRASYQEADLDARVRERYPTPAAYAADIPRLLRNLGFSPDRARFLADHIEVDPSRGAGHALGAARRDDRAHLRTRVGAGGMDYKGYNIAVHEMGHNVEQVFSLNTIDHTLLQGVPNTAFTEALAFVFQARDLELLGLATSDPKDEALRALEDFWATREIAGVALVDMAAWRWLYAHPDATPAQLKDAVVAASREVWNRHYAPIFGTRDVTLLAVYSHLINRALYTPDYPLGHLIAFQVERHLRAQPRLGEAFERLCQLGAITPDAWMRQGVGVPLSSGPLLAAASEALLTLAETR